MNSPKGQLSSQLMWPQIVAASVELIINKVLSFDSAKGSLEKLAQKTLTLSLAELGFPLSFTVNADLSHHKAMLVTSLVEHADCTIETSIKTLRELQENQQLTELIKQNKLDVTGDIKVAQQFATFGQQLDIDWQSELANHIGDVPTHKLSQLGKKIAEKFNFAKAQVQADASEYIVHEQRLVVTSSEINAFNKSVNQISTQVTAIEARIARLTEQSKP